ncbi:MAG: ABC transporter permease [Mesotoga sp.]|uniref:ABC transporter permease n=1 Tax=unclassified Mesotoga TaxID=1184398 RepID=UPI000EF19406|nr:MULTISPECIES: ABC transporter permease [unclassified Mesotoga]MDI9367182.1 ABC transporter permease [Thermotogota bacterium]NLT45552.1 ABC transporter permease [Thermotogaceae bacterium]MDD2333014.1 ABC transporter permease [Mesotoga sp.]MDD3679897.1 ABC transporter permease [Mesotoga sp.]MDD4206938.1 ABC transporter permease [Mesotoga sp.]
MKVYFLKRFLELIPIFFAISIIIFVIMNSMPGDPLLQMRMQNPRVMTNDPERMRELREYYHLDDPLPVKYFTWLKSVMTGDLGYSSMYKTPAIDLITSRLPNTLILTITAWLIGLVVALPIGILSAVKKYSAFDYTTTVFAFIGISLPGFWFALIAIIIFSVSLGWLPVSGMATYGITGSWNVFVDRLRHLVLPAFVLGLVQVASWVRYIRTSLLEVLDQDYVRTAYAKGVPDRKVIIKHALKNAMIPIITIIALDIPYFFGGALIIETVFSWPGMGRLMYNAVISSDYNLAISCLMFLAIITLISNLVADFLYVMVDPRIRMGRKGA